MHFKFATWFWYQIFSICGFLESMLWENFYMLCAWEIFIFSSLEVSVKIVQLQDKREKISFHNIICNLPLTWWLLNVEWKVNALVMKDTSQEDTQNHICASFWAYTLGSITAKINSCLYLVDVIKCIKLVPLCVCAHACMCVHNLTDIEDCFVWIFCDKITSQHSKLKW